MKSITKILGYCWSTLIYLVVGVLVFIAVSLSLARVLLPFIDDYKSDVESWVSDMIGQQVEIATLDAAWYGMEPQLVLKGVQLLSDDRMETLGYFQQARLGLDIISSALDARIRPGAFTIEGARFVLVRHEDGQISLEGFKDPASSNNAEKNRLLEEWFFKQRLLDVKNSEIVWLDLTKSKKTWLFEEVNLRFRNDGQRHWVDGWVNLPNSLGGRLQVAMDVRGSLLSANAWVGNVYLEGEKLNIAELARNFSLENLNVSAGEMDLRLWSQWRKAEIHSLHGNIDLSHVQLAAQDAPKIRVINQLSTNFSAIKNPTEWEATFDKINIESARRKWPETRVDFKYNPESGGLAAELGYFDLNEVLPVIGFFGRNNQELPKIIAGIKAKGIVSRLRVLANIDGDKTEYLAKGVISNFRSRSWKGIPALSELDGRFQFSNDGMYIHIPPQNITLDYREKFRYKHKIKNFGADFYASFNEMGLSIIGKNIDFKFRKVKTTGSFFYSNQHHKNAELDLAFYFKHGDLKDVNYYIPSKIMPDSTVKWLSESLLDGKIEQGSIMYSGALKGYPFNVNDGVFKVNLAVTNGKLKFADQWPIITAIEGVFDLNSKSLSFAGKSGVTFNAGLSDVIVKLPDYHVNDKVLLITGKAHGATADKLDYLYSSPMGAAYSEKLKPLKLSGQSELDLDLNIPLLEPNKTKIFGELMLKNNHLLADEWKLDVREVSTNLRFNNDGLWANDLKGLIRNTPIHGEIKTLRDDEGIRLSIQNTNIVSHGNVTELLDFFIDKAHWGQYLQGDALIDTELIIPLDASSKPLTFSLKSELLGMNVNLPYPLGKLKKEGKNLNLFTELTGAKRALQITYGSTSSVFEILATKNTQQIRRGGIGFQKQAEMPAEVGYRFSGSLAEFSWSEWSPLLIPIENKKALIEGGGSSGSIYFDVNVDAFSLYGFKFGAASVQASHTSQFWSLHLSGDEIEGNITVPVVISSAPLVIDMDRLYVNVDKGSAEESAGEVDPREMPEIKINVVDFKYEGIPFGSLEVNAVKIKDGLHLDKLNMNKKGTSITAEGDWVLDANGQASQFDISLKSKNYGRAIEDWGYANAIAGGKGSIKLNVNWPGNPSDFDFKIANGDVEIKVKDASMLNFELGAAKMFGLFLPRRLLLDFRDVFKKGMLFDEITGKYQIQAGDAFTSGLNFNGPILDIHMAGRIGLSKQDYDQVVTVNRRILGDSIPVLAFLTAATPLIAAQVFIFKKMFDQQIDDILSVQYTILGSWEEPLITPVIKNATTGEDLTEDIFAE